MEWNVGVKNKGNYLPYSLVFTNIFVLNSKVTQRYTGRLSTSLCLGESHKKHMEQRILHKLTFICAALFGQANFVLQPVNPPYKKGEW